MNSFSPTKPTTLNRSSPSISRIEGIIRKNPIAKGQRQLVLFAVDRILGGVEPVFRHEAQLYGIPVLDATLIRSWADIGFRNSATERQLCGFCDCRENPD
ncbi:hypothetical protein [Mesorhizobium sp.]|uniref:hypothetical protein n=1 Tax=Mesorhizobium sp. TaxID=1871066 RepID=UPI00257A03C9|nr:hypothetical protein [Mesorhizobium sp.]